MTGAGSEACRAEKKGEKPTTDSGEKTRILRMAPETERSSFHVMLNGAARRRAFYAEGQEPNDYADLGDDGK